MKARRPYVRVWAIIFLLVLQMLVALYGCARNQERSSLSQTQETSRSTAEQVSQPDSKPPGKRNRIVTQPQQTSEDHPQEVNQVSNRTIEEVKTDWEERLMAMPGVMGVGIGLTQDRQQTCIKVYVNRQASAQVDQIPQEIEGYPVEVEIRKPFRAF